MKKTVIIFPIFFCILSFAQNPYSDYKKFQERMKPDSNRKRFDLLTDSSKVSKERFNVLKTGSTAKLLFVQENGTKVYALPQDNMPCLVPDNKNDNMPNLAKGKKVDGMPPGSAPKVRIIPKTD